MPAGQGKGVDGRTFLHVNLQVVGQAGAAGLETVGQRLDPALVFRAARLGFQGGEERAGEFLFEIH